MTAAKETRGDPEHYATRSRTAKLADRVCQHNRVHPCCTIGTNRFCAIALAIMTGYASPCLQQGRPLWVYETLAEMELVTALDPFGPGVRADPCPQLPQPARQA